MTERNPSLTGIECGKPTFGDGTQLARMSKGRGISFRAGEGLPAILPTWRYWQAGTAR